MSTRLTGAVLATLIATPLIAQTTTTVVGPTVKLSWIAPTTWSTGAALTGTTTYNLYRGACNSTATFAKIQTGIGGISAVDSTAVVGTTYGYRVTAVNSAVESAQSVTVCAVIGVVPPVAPPPPAIVPPSVPTGLAVLPS